jgi:hypothetical protein
MKLVQVYLEPERYNARIKATIPGAWIAVFDNGDECPVCADYQAKNESEARKFVREYQ